MGGLKLRKSLAKTPRRKFSETLQRAEFQNLFWKTSVVDFFYNQTAGINSESVTLAKGNLQQGAFLVNTL